MSTVNQIIGGAFNDSQGGVLANGYLIFELNQDEKVNTITQVCSGRQIKIPLDSNGSVPVSPVYNLWPNDVLVASGSFYLVSAYTSKGQLVWGPNAQSVLSSPSPYNLGAWIADKI
jgi:hypothetical protein